MLTLAINTASSVTCIALISAGEVLAEESWQSQNNEAERLMPAIDAMLKATGYCFDNLDAVLAISGPGSFTGLRIGVTTANTIAYLLGCKLFAVNTFDYWHEQNFPEVSPTPDAPAAAGRPPSPPVLVFAGKGGVYFSQFGHEPRQLTLDELPQVLKAEAISEICGDISPDQQALLAHNQVSFNNSALTFGQVCCKILANQPTPIATITPLYVKEPSITLKRLPSNC